MYKNKDLLEKFEWKDVTDKLTWKEREGGLQVGGVLADYSSVLIKRKGKSRMEINPLFTTMGRGCLVPFGHGIYWLTTVNGKQRLLYLLTEKGSVNDLRAAGC